MKLNIYKSITVMSNHDDSYTYKISEIDTCILRHTNLRKVKINCCDQFVTLPRNIGGLKYPYAFCIDE